VRYQLCHCGDTGAVYSSLNGFPTPFFAFWSIFRPVGLMAAFVMNGMRP